VTRPVAGIESATGIVARLAVAALVLALTNAARAQTVVSITATDSAAAETWPGQAPNSANIRIAS
jgi:hypothetical protein